MGRINPVRGMALGQGTPIERRERLRELQERLNSSACVIECEKVRLKTAFPPQNVRSLNSTT
jgi:hypothetical protein